MAVVIEVNGQEGHGMKVVLLAGGFGTRLSEETHARPKPMIEVGGLPLLLHIMKMYSHHGFNDFIVCLGYMGYYIKEYFSNYLLHRSDVSIDFTTGATRHFNTVVEPWRVSLIDTGLNSMTGGRLRRVRELIGNETFMMTYGDGVSDLDIEALVAFHRVHKRTATITAVSLQGALVHWNSSLAARSRHFARSRQTRQGGSTAAFSCLNHPSSIFSMAMTPFGNVSRSRSLQSVASLSLTDIQASGSRSTHCAKRTSSSLVGIRAPMEEMVRP